MKNSQYNTYTHVRHKGRTANITYTHVKIKGKITNITHIRM